MNVKDYLLNCSKEELIDILSQVPAIRDFITNKHKEDYINKLENLIPIDLLTNYHLESTYNGEASRILKRYILSNFNGGDMHLLLNKLGLININFK